MNKKIRGGLLLIIGMLFVVLGIAAVYFLTRQVGLVGGITAKPTPVNESSSKAVVLTHDMKLGDVIKLEDLQEITVPTNILPRDPVINPADVVGKFIKMDLIQGEILLSHHVADPTNVNQDLAFVLSEEHVMMAIAIDDTMTYESIVKRGDIVDILVSVIEVVPPQANTTDQTGTTTVYSGTPVDEGTNEPLERLFTFDAFQKTNITALVLEVIPDESKNSSTGVLSNSSQNAAPPEQTRIKAYLLALKPQDALVLKHLKDIGGVFDFVLRNPTSTQTFELTPVTEEYIIELFGLQILK